ncbi:MAG: Ig-like domain-containing protein [Bryobacteraceae bacterium]
MSIQLKWKVNLIDGTTALDLTDDARTSYTSSKPEVCSFGGKRGQVFAGSVGNCTITVTNNTLSFDVPGSVQTFTPKALSSVAIPGFANNVAVNGRYAYVAAGSAGLQVVDAVDPLKPVIVASRSLPGNANGVFVAGGFAYVASGTAGLQIVSLANPLAPVVAGSLNTGGEAWDLVVTGNRAYVANGGNGLAIVDVTFPAAPVRLGSLSLGGTSKGVDVDTVRQIAVVARGGNGLSAVSVANPAAPILLGTIPTVDARDVAISGNFAFAADFTGSFKSVDLSDPSVPVLRATTPPATGGYLTDVAVFGTLAAGADVFFVNGVPLIDVTNPGSPQPRFTIDFSGILDDNATGIALDPTYVYFTAERGTVANFTENGVNGTTRLYIGQYQSIQDNNGVSPTVSIVSPLPGGTVTEGATINVTVNATDDVGIASVDLLLNGQLIETRTTSPYQFSTTAPVGGTSLTLSARATDFGNNTALSTIVTLNVVPSPPPTVQIASPVAGTLLREGATIPVVVQASGSVPIKRVDLAVNGQTIDSDFKAPYELLFTVPVGVTSLTFRASAEDNIGKTALSANEVVQVAVDPMTNVQGVVVDSASAPAVGAQVWADLSGLSAAVFNFSNALTTMPNLTGLTPTTTKVVSTPNMPNPGTLFGSNPFGFGLTPSRAVRFAGNLRVSVPGSYAFSLRVNAGGRLIINGTPIINLPNSTGASQTATGTIVLSNGDTPIELQVFDNGSPEVVLRYTPPGSEMQAIPPSALVPAVPVYQTSSGASGAFTIAGVPTVLGNIGASAVFSPGGGTMQTGRAAPVAPVPGGVTNVGPIQLGAPTTVMNFESLATPGTGYTFSFVPYTEAGFTITPKAVGLPPPAEGGFCLIQTGNTDLFMGSTGLSNCFAGGTNTLTKVGGGTFSLVSIDLAPFGRSSGYGGGAQVTFVGTKAGGTTVSRTFTAPLTFNFATYQFSGFDNLVSVVWTHVSPYHQFDNVKLQ